MILKLLTYVMSLWLATASWASAQNRNLNTLAELASYMGADREQVLFEGAKAEGKVVWYTSLYGGSYKALGAGSEGKYPGVGVEVYRAPGSDLALRITEEAQARRN